MNGWTEEEFTAFTSPAGQTYLDPGETGYIEYSHQIDGYGEYVNVARVVEIDPPLPEGTEYPEAEERFRCDPNDGGGSEGSYEYHGRLKLLWDGREPTGVVGTFEAEWECSGVSRLR